MYRDKNEWSDLKELPEDDSVAIVSIRYSEEYNEVFNYFRAVWNIKEFSVRALNLTSHALHLNPNNYNVWIYRRLVLKNIKYDPKKELDFIEKIIREHPKNFLGWEHRRVISKLNLSFCDADIDLKLTEDVLQSDPKSYHAWQHRQWIVQTFKYSNTGLFSNELKFTEDFINEDIRNNSAWNQRFYIIKQRGKVDSFLVKKEFSFVVEKIKLAFENESSWNYLRGLLNQFHELKNNSIYKSFLTFLDCEFYEKHKEHRHLVAFLIDVKIENVLKSQSKETAEVRNISQLCNDLMAKRFDPLRKNYWEFIYKNFSNNDKLRLTKNDNKTKKEENIFVQRKKKENILKFKERKV